MWFRRLPFQTLLVFSLGIGLGFAWKVGYIPLELSPANTGRLSKEISTIPEAEFPLDLRGQIEPERNHVSTTDPAVFAAQSEPSATDLNQGSNERNSAPPLRLPPSTAVIPADANRENEPAWARPAKSQLREEPAGFTSEPRHLPAKSTPREIRLVSNQEPSGSALDSAPRESGESPLVETFKTVDEQIANKEFLSAHRTLSKLYWNQKEGRGEILSRLQVTARAIFFEPKPDLIEPYVVQPNDQLRMIANKYQLSWEYLSKLNRIDPRRLQPKQKLKVLKGPFSAVVDLNEFALTVHLQGYFVKRYEVGIGKDEASPLGKFPVLNKIENPEYTGPDGKVIAANDPANPLGERWIDLGDSYGIHGTIEPESIGKAASRGCIRMRTDDVIEVYNFLVKGSEVLIRK